MHFTKNGEMSYNFEKKIAHKQTAENVLDRCRPKLSKLGLNLQRKEKMKFMNDF